MRPAPTPKPLHRRRRSEPRLDPNYGVGYRPDWPSILSVAHDETDGGRLFLITDRPCVLVPGPLALPLSVGGLSILGASEILPIKFRLEMSGPVPQGAAWTWGPGASSLIDPLSNHAPNPASGFCADTPGPYGPPAPLTLVFASFDAITAILRLGFDRPIDIGGLVANQLIVDDGDSGTRYGGIGAGTLFDPATVDVDLSELEAGSFPDTRLDAGAGSGIVAADDGGTWHGVTDRLLPFP